MLSWVTPAGSLGTVIENNTATSITLAAQGVDVKFKLISGQLPDGLSLNSLGIISGTPSPVLRITRSNFVVRISSGNNVLDRTFSIDVSGPSLPYWDDNTSLSDFVNTTIVSYSKQYQYDTYGQLTEINSNYQYGVYNSSDQYIEIYGVDSMLEAALKSVSLNDPIIISFLDTNHTIQEFKFQSITTTNDTVYSDNGGDARIYISGNAHNSLNDLGFSKIEIKFLRITNNNEWLLAGISNEPFIQNHQYVNFQLQAHLPLTSPPKAKLTYFIENNNGKLPPGLSLSDNGIISGFVDDILVYNENQSKSGGYDTETYDMYTYDHYADVSSDNTFIGYPKVYNFKATVTDGITRSTSSVYKMLIVNPSMIRNTGGRKLLPSEMVEYIKTRYTKTITTSTFYADQLSTTNLLRLTLENDQYSWIEDIQLSTTTNFYIFGDGPHSQIIPEIIRIEKNFSSGFYEIYTTSTVNINFGFHAINSSAKIGYNIGVYGEELNYFPTLQFIKDTNLGSVRANNNVGIDISAYDPYPKFGEVFYELTTTTNILTNLPPYLTLHSTKGLIYGYAPYQPAYEIPYTLTITASKIYENVSYKNTATFNLIVKGEVENTIEWVTDSDLGSIDPGKISELSVNAVHKKSDYSIKYNLTSGKLPLGLTLSRDGTITGMVDYNISGNFVFAITASDVYGSSSITKSFSLEVLSNSDIIYTKIYTKPFMNLESRDSYKTFITNEFTFAPELMYRYFDPNFGVQNDLKLYLEFGIERADDAAFIAALRENFYKRRLYLNNPKIAIAKNINGDVVYEIVYLDIIDPQINSNGESTESVLYDIKDQNKIFYPSSITNMRKNLSLITMPDGNYIDIDDNFLPKFMQTFQPDYTSGVGYIAMIPLCYALPGNGARIISRIKISGFNFNSIDFEIDRLIIEGDSTGRLPKYLRFPRNEIGQTITEDTSLYGPDGVLIQWP